MSAPPPPMRLVRLRELAGRVRLDLQGTATRAALDDQIRGTEPDALVALDLRGLEYLGYSHAKGSLREVLIDRAQGRYDQRRLVLVADQSPEFLDGLVDGLQQMGMFALVLRTPDTLEQAALVGEVSRHLGEVFQELRAHGPLSVESLAARVGQSPTAVEVRLDLLLEMGVASRVPRAAGRDGDWLFRVL